MQVIMRVSQNDYAQRRKKADDKGRAPTGLPILVSAQSNTGIAAERARSDEVLIDVYQGLPRTPRASTSLIVF
ncbi:hypothetical protein VPNG_02246 [Cytospora leucostoma]|uniref:Uncharacterized protein n=1 Tax=Cytospora leucostoma TaxID=1230097 RepID=A0A423XGS1_9PEZI|nr:hypothetical protein VPNG_02246 [Cytospora leucostoma]